ncbi:2Fe-2S ferredoxin [Sphingobium sp. OAS761]|uniref:2Fe-2S iron-sulfur cluster-binding protein n=1 Tax=Sphingobium sp. OAS761 TaxID=2817901 RepID=UPI00209EA633|nr:2Fe-2S iron-sulfur cluster-binding protein [Sphingobium sp. OAS761]MCP1471637.1 2Fe-2S ferredoxin [Sphingobium sp. OAS761]
MFSHTADAASSKLPSDEAHILVTTPDGAVRSIPACEGMTLMELIRDAGIEELAAYCGGNCSCATCHVHVAPAWAGALPEVSEAEAALIETSENATPFSRLSCQLPFSAALSGLAVTVVPAE